jgi:hypothetical protein
MIKELETIRELVSGSIFTKYGRVGKPHQRLVMISPNEDRVLWMEGAAPPSKGECRHMKLSEIVDVL